MKVVLPIAALLAILIAAGVFGGTKPNASALLSGRRRPSWRARRAPRA